LFPSLAHRLGNLEWFTPTGVEASAAQKQPVTKTCLQCGAVLPLSALACKFCDDASLSADGSRLENYSASHAEGDPGSRARGTLKAQEQDCVPPAASSLEDSAWRNELNDRVQAYRARRRKPSPNQGQSHLPFEERSSRGDNSRSVAVEDCWQPRQAEDLSPDDFAFTIAIGRPAPKRIQENARMVIDVSLPVQAENFAAGQALPELKATSSWLQRAASLDNRRLAALIDAGCLLFAYGAFLALFGSLGGQLTFSKISAAVYFATFAFVYVQYFGLFTIFGGTTPGMMMRSLQIINFSGEPPTSRQLFLRTAGYVLSAGTFFLGFLWAMWDEDELTWHDRLSHTYLSRLETLADMEASPALRGN
jgi:uncharacterized RDD family membrane protein YckC/ribosomal protein L40E